MINLCLFPRSLDFCRLRNKFSLTEYSLAIEPLRFVVSLVTGTKLGPYEIVSLVGAGGMGEVYRAHDTRLGREVAIKVLPTDYADDADRLSRFKQEACASSAL